MGPRRSKHQGGMVSGGLPPVRANSKRAAGGTVARPQCKPGPVCGGGKDSWWLWPGLPGAREAQQARWGIPEHCGLSLESCLLQRPACGSVFARSSHWQGGWEHATATTLPRRVLRAAGLWASPAPSWPGSGTSPCPAHLSPSRVFSAPQMKKVMAGWCVQTPQGLSTQGPRQEAGQTTSPALPRTLWPLYCLGSEHQVQHPTFEPSSPGPTPVLVGTSWPPPAPNVQSILK